MQIVIDIPEKLVCEGFERPFTEEEKNVLIKAIGNGTPLPKGHGRLIDADKLLDSDGIIADSRKCHYIPMIDVYQAPTIIEADKSRK